MSLRWLVQSNICLTKSDWRGVLASADFNEPGNYFRSRRMCAPFSRSLIPTTTTPRTHEHPKSRCRHPRPPILWPGPPNTSSLVFRNWLLKSNYWAVSWLIRVDPSGCARRNNLDRDIYRLDVTLVTHQVYVPAAYVGEALACVINMRSAATVR